MKRVGDGGLSQSHNIPVPAAQTHMAAMHQAEKSSQDIQQDPSEEPPVFAKSVGAGSRYSSPEKESYPLHNAPSYVESEKTGSPTISDSPSPPAAHGYGITTHPDLLGESQVAIKILVSNNASGLIIGRSGKTISDFQEKTHTRIKLSQGGDYYPGTTDRVCLIQGTPTNANAAVEMVLSKLYEVQALQQIHHLTPQTTSPPNESSSFIVRLLVPTACCGMIIGRGGSNIKMLKETSGVTHIQLSPKEHGPMAIGPTAIAAAVLTSTSERILTITGPHFGSCLKCTKTILSEMALNPEISRYINMTTSYSKAVSAAQSTFGLVPVSSLFSTQIESVPQHNRNIASIDPSQSLDSSFTPTSFGGLNPDSTPYLPLDENPTITHQRQQQSPRHSESFPMTFGSGIYDSITPGDMSQLAPDGTPTSVQPQMFSQSPLSTSLRNDPANAPNINRSSSSPGLIFPQHYSIIHTEQAWPAETLAAGTPVGSPSRASGGMSPIDQLSQSFQAQTLQSAPMMQSQIVIPAQPVTAQFGVPNSRIGSILGRSGSMLNEIQTASNTTIRISQRNEYIPGTKDRIVTITGPTAQNVQTAQNLIHQRLTKGNSNYTGGTRSPSKTQRRP